jgi:transposase
MLRPELLGIQRGRRWTREQTLAVLNEIGVNGASISDVARRHDVPRRSLYQWRHDLRHRGLGDGDKVTVTPVVSSAELPQAHAGSPAIEFVLHTGRGLRGVAGLSEGELTHLFPVIVRP